MEGKGEGGALKEEQHVLVKVTCDTHSHSHNFQSIHHP